MRKTVVKSDGESSKRVGGCQATSCKGTGHYTLLKDANYELAHGQGITFGFAVCPEVEAEGSESEDLACGTVLTDDSVCGLATERLDLMALRSASGIGNGVGAATDCF